MVAVDPGVDAQRHPLPGGTVSQQPLPEDLARLLTPIKAQIQAGLDLANTAITAYYTGKGVRGARVDLDRMLVDLPDEEPPGA